MRLRDGLCKLRAKAEHNLGPLTTRCCCDTIEKHVLIRENSNLRRKCFDDFIRRVDMISQFDSCFFAHIFNSRIV